MSDAIQTLRAIEAISSLDLADQMALALRNVGNILDAEARYAAYFRANVDLINTTKKEQDAADEAALSIELMLRRAGHQ